MAQDTKLCPCHLDIPGQDAIEVLPEYRNDRLPGERYTRIFTLLRRPEGTPIVGHLSVISLEKPEYAYNALSWAWGATDVRHAIVCDGRRAMINCNLYSALVRLRSANTQDTVWFIDAISIDQSQGVSALEERGSQVRRMDEVFRRAGRVRINIGESVRNQAGVFQLIRALRSVDKDTWVRMTHDPKENRGFHLPPWNSDIWKSFADLFSRPWFKRVWVVQEYALARRADFMLGTDQFEITDLLIALLRANDWMFMVRSDGEPRDDGTESLQLEAKLSFNIRLDESCHFHSAMTWLRSEQVIKPLSEVLYLKSTFETSDARDKAYATLGLA